MASATKKEEEKKKRTCIQIFTYTYTYIHSVSFPFSFCLSVAFARGCCYCNAPWQTHTHTHTNYPIYTDASFFFFFCVCSFNSSVYNMSTFKKKSIHKHTKRKTNCGCALVKPVTVAPTLRFGFFFLPLLCCDYCSCCNKNSARESVFFFPLFLTRCVCVCLLFTVCTSTNSILFSFSRSTHKKE